MNNSYALTDAERAAWEEELENLTPPSLKQIAIARRLTTECGGKTGSYRTTLSQFFKGQTKGLKSILEHNDRTRVVARMLGLEPTRFNALLRKVRGLPQKDAPGEVRVPGFEDMGALPVAEAFYLPVHHTQFASGENSMGPGGERWVEQLVAAATPEQGRAKLLLVVGGPGSGRSPLLKLIRWHLEQDGVQVLRGPQPLEGAGVLILDDLGRLETPERVALTKELKESGSVLLASSGPSCVLDGLPESRTVVKLKAGGPSWSLGFLDHLAGLMRQHWGREVDFSKLREWMEDDPIAASLTTRLDTLGLLARHVADGGEVPIEMHELPRLLVERSARRLRQRGRREVALLMEVFGERILSELGRSLLTHPLPWPAKSVLEAIGAATDEADTANLAEHLELLVALEEAALVFRLTDGWHPSQPLFMVAAFGQVLATPQPDPVLVQTLAVRREWDLALAAAAEDFGDSAPLLHVMLDGSPALLSQAMPALTRLLTAQVRCSEPAVLARAFELALCWWARVPAESRSTTMRFGAVRDLTPPPETAQLVGGLAPLLVMGIASQLHHNALPDLCADLLVEGRGVTEALRGYLELLGRWELSEQAALEALAIGAPWQSEAILNPQAWRKLDPRANERTLPGALTTEELALWWRTLAAARLAEEPDGDDRLAGLHPDSSIVHGMGQGRRGSATWADALLRRLQADAEGAPEAFARAIKHTLTHGAGANDAALRGIWGALQRERRCVRVRHAVWRELEGYPLTEWRHGQGFLAWLLAELLEEDARDALWHRWSELPAVERRHVPWDSLLDGGLPLTTLVGWALTQDSDEERPNGQLHQETQGGLIILQATGPVAHEAREILEHALEQPVTRDLYLMLLEAPKPWGPKAAGRLLSESEGEARALRLELAANQTRLDARVRLLGSLWPRPEERSTWEAIRDSSTCAREQVFRALQLASIAEAPDEALTSLKSQLEWLAIATLEPDARASRLEAWNAEKPNEDTHEEDELRVHAFVDELAAEWRDALFEAGIGLQRGVQGGAAALTPLVDWVMTHPILGPRISTQGAWWALAWEHLGAERVEALLHDGARGPEVKTRNFDRLSTLIDLGLYTPLVHRLVADPIMGDTATALAALRVRPSRTDLMLEVLEARAEVSGLSDDVSIGMARRLGTLEPAAALSWLRDAATSWVPARQARWWGALVTAMPASPERVEAVDAWLSARAAIEFDDRGESKAT
ncbi:MAG: hypothetical protein H6741_24370 [Alphaproteobacteria bacterium]|nr:hypothetical protein [Alphaproteobacteria bacterium]